MWKKDKIQIVKYTPQHFLSYGIMIYLFLYIIGPYSFEIRNGGAIVYLIIAYVIWYLGIKCACVTGRQIHIDTEKDREWKISDFSECILVVIEGLNFVATVVYALYFVVHIISGQSLGDFRVLASGMPFIFKLIQAESYITVGIYIIVSYGQVQSKLLKLISKIGIFIPVAITMLSGARWTLFVVLIVFGIVEKTRVKDRKTSKFLKIVFFIAICILLGICFLLFMVRGVSSTYTTQMPYYGKIEVKSIWHVIGDSSLGKPIYNIFYYFTHSVPYYAQIFDQIDVSNLHFGAYMFRVIGFFFSSFPAYNSIAKQIPCLVGSYTPFVTGYMRDFGLFGTLIVTFFTGLVMGKLYKYKKRSRVALVLQPYMLTMCVLSPLYYIWHVGSIDFMIVTAIALCAILQITNKIYIRK